MSFSWIRASAVAEKEIFHILRDPFTIALSIGLPMFMVIVFGLAIEFNVKNIPLAISDQDQTQTSRRLVEIFGSSDYFIPNYVYSPIEAQQAVLGDRARAALIIPGGFQKDLFSGYSSEVQLLLDGSDNSTVSPILSYLSSIQDIVNDRLADYKPIPKMELRTRFLFNPELNSRWFVIPGLIVVVMSILSILLTALTIAREWENGSMELLLSTPVRPLEFIVGKLFPYAILGILAVIFVYLIATLVFLVPFKGSYVVFTIGVLLFLITYLAQGLLISVLTRKQLIAMQVAIISGLLPSQLLSGFIFPIQSMPSFFQYFTMLLPARWFMTISRESFLKGSTLFDLGIPLLVLAVMATIMIFLATRNFKKDLEP